MSEDELSRRLSVLAHLKRLNYVELVLVLSLLAVEVVAICG